MPVLERRRAPFTVFCATGFVEGHARLWWLELEEAIRRLEAVEVPVAGQKFSFAAAHARGKDCGLREDLLAAARPA